MSPDFRTVDASAPIELAADEGLLVLRVDSALPISQVSTRTLDLYHGFEPGLTQKIFRVKAGRYGWRNARIPSDNPFGGLYRIDRDAYRRPEELDFEIVPGRLNYAGDLVVRRGSFETLFRGNRIIESRSISIRLRNRAGSAIRRLETDHPELLDRYGLHLASESDDRFIDFYLAERERLREARSSTPDPAPTPTPTTALTPALKPAPSSGEATSP